jgi:small subunit ribosomal protein S4
MARYTDAKCRLCRRLGIKLFLKGKRCTSAKCPIDRKGAVPPGMRGTKVHSRLSEYGTQLKEKQKAKRIYGVLERQFKKYFLEARKVRGASGEALLQILESRLDNIVYRLGFVNSRSIARQLISHGHFLVNNKKVNIPSFRVKPGDIISISAKGMKIPQISETFSEKSAIIPEWLEKKAAIGKVKRLPKREEIESDINEQLIVEFYSR